MNIEFSSKSEKLLRDEMCICLDDLRNHLISKAPAKLEFFQQFLDFITELKLPNDYYELGDAKYCENDEYLNKEILSYSENKGIKRDTEEYFIVDSIRHAFISFMFGGLCSLYKNREAENWYPKIIIREQLGNVNLKGEVIIYRGTSKYEYDSGRFSQSWTLKEEVAHDFAFKHYDIHDDYVNTQRVVLKSRINACNIYYYDKDDDEQEVIIDERELIEYPPSIFIQRILN